MNAGAISCWILKHKDGQGKGLVFNFQLSISFINKKIRKKVKKKKSQETHTHKQKESSNCTRSKKDKVSFKDNSVLAVMFNVDNVLLTDLIIMNERACKS